MLDRTKDFGHCGSNMFGWKYYQDGKYFNLAGEELDDQGNLVEKRVEVVSDDVDTDGQELAEGTKKTEPIPKPTPKKRTPRKVAGDKK